MTFAITDTALRKIADTVGRQEPESGGALMGPAGSDLVSDFIFDPQASVTGSSYVPSRWLQKEVNLAESAEGTLTLKGILHSHPAGMNRPSSTDLESFETYLKANEDMDGFAAIICTFASSKRHRSSALQPNELASPDGSFRYSFFRASATGGRAAKLRSERPRVCNVEGFLTAVVEQLGSGWSHSEPVTTTVDGVGGMLAEVKLRERAEALFFVSSAFPVAPPAATFESAHSSTDAFQGLPWDLSLPLSARVSAVADAIGARFVSVDRASFGHHNTDPVSPRPWTQPAAQAGLALGFIAGAMTSFVCLARVARRARSRLHGKGENTSAKTLPRKGTTDVS